MTLSISSFDIDRTSGIREAQKAETRAKVVEAARSLFEERGYAEATIREIAKRAGVAPGSVFTTFESKAHLLQAIIFDRYDELFAVARNAAETPGTAVARLTAFSHACYRQELGEIRLLAENIGASWTWPRDADDENRKRLAPLFAIIMNVLTDAVKSGEIRADVDKQLIADTIFSCYLRNFRKAIFDRHNAQQVAAYLSRQIELILNGVRA